MEYNIHPEDLKRIELYLEKKGLYLQEISKSVNDLAIAHVSIEDPKDIMEEYSSFDIVIDLRKNLCCKFDFYGYRTDGLRIYNRPKAGTLRIFDPPFNMSFINTVFGYTTSYILVTYLDFTYDSRFDKGNYEGKIYASIIDFSALVNFNNSACFKFDDCLNYSNSVKVYLIDDEKYPGLFAYRLISKSNYCDSYDYEYEAIEQGKFDGIWNITNWCTNKRIIPLNGENIYDKAEEIIDEIRSEQQQDSKDDYEYLEEQARCREEEEDIKEANRQFEDMMNEYDAWWNID